MSRPSLRETDIWEAAMNDNIKEVERFLDNGIHKVDDRDVSCNII